MKILIDPTQEDSTILAVDNREEFFPHAARDAGAGLIAVLKKLKISERDQINIISGPGNFAAVRTACLVANAVRFMTGCQLFARSRDNSEFRSVEICEPFYSAPPSITPPKKS